MTILNAEYLQIGGVPLSSYAYVTEDAASILDGASTRGQDLVNPVRAGTVARRRILDAREITIPVVVTGYYDADGNTNADPRQGLIDNINALKNVLKPAITLGGQILLEWVTPTITRYAYVHVNSSIQVSSVGPHAARMVISAVNSSGVWKSSTATTHTIATNSPTTTTTTNITVAGTGEVQDAVITFTGAASTFKITNNTFNGAYVQYSSTITTSLAINAGTYTATLNGSTQVGGKIVNANSPIWLPLVAGVNSITVLLSGGAGNRSTSIVYNAVWL